MKKSAGILLYKIHLGETAFLLVHPGGPYWKSKDAGSWSIPKGEFTDEEPLQAAIREFEEETGTSLEGDFTALSPIKLKSGKVVYAWALEHDLDTALVSSNTFEMEWPPRTGIMQSYPEIDKAGWFNTAEAIEKINTAQSGFIRELLSKIE